MEKLERRYGPELPFFIYERRFWKRPYGRFLMAGLDEGPEDFVPSKDRVLIKAVEFSSPGFWEFLGKLVIWETARKYINDCDERRKDREWREKQQKDAGDIENVSKLLDVAERLKAMGHPDSVVNGVINRYVMAPLDRLVKRINLGPFKNPRVLPYRPPSNPENAPPNNPEGPPGQKMME
jgi:hypothetical protein